MSEPLRVAVPRPAPEARLDRFLAKHIPGMTVERARALLEAGAVTIAGKRAKVQRRLFGGEVVEIAAQVARAVRRVEGPALRVLADSQGVVVIDKPAGFPVEPEPRQVSIVELAASQLGAFEVGGVAAPGVAHRLDKETTGCLALARTDSALGALKNAFEQKQVRKIYLAVVLGVPASGARLEGPYGRDPENPRKYTTRAPSARRASLSFEVVERFAAASLLRVTLETGRTHQIRVQLSEAGFPLLGDPIYGTRESREQSDRTALHAESLAIEPLGVDVRAPLPQDLEKLLARLRGS